MFNKVEDDHFGGSPEHVDGGRAEQSHDALAPRSGLGPIDLGRDIGQQAPRLLRLTSPNPQARRPQAAHDHSRVHKFGNLTRIWPQHIGHVVVIATERQPPQPEAAGSLVELIQADIADQVSPEMATPFPPRCVDQKRHVTLPVDRAPISLTDMPF